MKGIDIGKPSKLCISVKNINEYTMNLQLMAGNEIFDVKCPGYIENFTLKETNIATWCTDLETLLSVQCSEEEFWSTHLEGYDLKGTNNSY